MTACLGRQSISMNNLCTFVGLLLLLGMISAPDSAADETIMTSEATAQDKHEHTNHLIGETSPYLLQHAHNPVDWYPWCDEALDRAREQNKPILLSIGYSACHWCHVMERESFENEGIAKILNEHFVAIKVDREERPDLDDIYMAAVQLITGSGGWPLNVFLTPDLKPFFGGTYFPPVEKHGQPGFGAVLVRVAEVWQQDPGRVTQRAEQLTEAVQRSLGGQASESVSFEASVVDRAIERLRETFDARWGGFAAAPKFPPTGAIAFLLRRYHQTNDQQILKMVTTTLDRMAYGGMYDQIGGGFHRYSVDDRWLVPHFEKMLYDNALLARAYTEAWQTTCDPLYKRIATETLDYVLRDMTDRHGGFHSAEDADSEGVEGKFYVWDPGEIEAVLGDEDAALFCGFYDVTPEGNFEGRSILHVPIKPDVFARGLDVPAPTLVAHLAEMRERLRAVRDKRVHPGKDDKIIASWNGMMISALARGHQAFGDVRYCDAAVRAADFVLTRMVRDGTLMRTYRGVGPDKTGTSKLPAYLDDYAEVAGGLIDLYEATFDVRWLREADRLVRIMVRDFADEQHGGFFSTAHVHEHLLVRAKNHYDGAVPAGNSTAALVLARLSVLLGEDRYREMAEATLGSAHDAVARYPAGYLNLLTAADFLMHPTREIVIVAPRDSGELASLLDQVHARFVPNKVLAAVAPDAADRSAVEQMIPLLAHKSMVAGKATVYVCENRTCKNPVTDATALSKLLDQLRDVQRNAG